MSGARAKAEQIVSNSKKQYSDSIRVRLIAQLTRDLEDLERIRGDEDAGVEIHSKQDDHDGIESLTPDMVKEKEDKRINDLKSANFFASPSAVMVVPVDAQTDINARGQFGYTRLIQAVVDHDVAAVKELLANQKVNRDAKDTSGATALDKALNRGYQDIVELFR